MAVELFLNELNQKIAKVIMALIADRRTIVSKGFNQYATFFLGNTPILLGSKEIMIGDTKFNLGLPPKK